MKIDVLVPIVCAFILCGCGQKAQVASEFSGERTPWAAITELTDTQQKRRGLAVAKEKLFKSLLGELTTAIGKDGVPSIQVCKSQAPALAKLVGEEFGLTIGGSGRDHPRSAWRPLPGAKWKRPGYPGLSTIGNSFLTSGW